MEKKYLMRIIINQVTASRELLLGAPGEAHELALKGAETDAGACHVWNSFGLFL